MIKIVNESGISNQTKILNAKTGEDLGQRLAIGYGATIKIDRHYITMECEIIMLGGDITADSTKWFTKHPITGEYAELAEMRFRDGAVVTFDERGDVTLPEMKEP